MFCELFGFKQVVLKDIFSKEKLIERITQVKSVSLTYVDNINFGSSIQDYLSRDIYGFNLEKIRIEFKFQETNIMDSAKTLLSDILRSKESFRKVMIIGRCDNRFDFIFGLNEFAYTVTFKLSELISLIENGAEIFEKLISEIEKTKK